MRRQLTVTFESVPYAAFTAQAGIDFTLAAAAFIEEINILFLGDGIYQLLKTQNPQKNFHNFCKQIPMFTHLDCSSVYADLQSLITRGLTANDIIDTVKILSTQEIKMLLGKSDIMISF